MRVVDFHVHVGTVHHVVPPFISNAGESNPGCSDETCGRITPAVMSAYLNSQGVDKAVVLPKWGSERGITPTNEFISAFCRATTRLIPFASISLREGKQAAGEAERCIRELRCRGLIVTAPYMHFHPADSRMLPVYEVASAMEIPVMFRTGTPVRGHLPLSYGGHPLLLDDLAKQFPRLKIVMSHGGYPLWCTDAEGMLERHKNCCIEIAGIPASRISTVFPRLEKFRDRFLFGSDWPGIPSIADRTRKIQELPLNAATIQAMLWENGSVLLGMGSNDDWGKGQWPSALC